ALIDVEQRELILRVRKERVVLKMNDEALKLISSSDNTSITSEHPMVSLVEDTRKGVRQLLQPDNVNKTGVTTEENHTKPPDIQQTKTRIEESEGTPKTLEGSKTSIPKSIKKNNRRTEIPINSFIYTKWVPVTKENKPLTISKWKQKSSVLMNGRECEKFELD